MVRENFKRVTIHDIARVADTSATTVSRVLSKNGYPVSQKLKSRVRKVAKELNYKPNIIAQSLKMNISRDIGVVIPTITNPFYSNAVLGMEEVAQKNNYNLLLCNTFRDPKREDRYLDMLYEKQVDGIILSSISEDPNKIKEIKNNGVNFVLMDQKIPDLDCSFVSFDARLGAKMEIEYLIQSGHRKIAFITTPITRWTRRMIYQGYKDAILENNLHFDDEFLFISQEETEYDEEGYEVKVGIQLADEFINRKIDATAVLAVNDMVAFGFIKGLSEKGINVPKDISVMGFDDISYASLFTPRLSTISYPSYDTGKLSAQILFDNLNGGKINTLNIKLEPKLVIRDSVYSIR